MVKTQFLEEIPYHNNIFEKLQRFSSKTLKNWQPVIFFKNPYCNPFILAVVSHPHLLMGSLYLSSTILYNQIIIVQLPMI